MDKGRTIIIERGYFQLGVSHADGSETEQKWINDGTSNGIVIGIVDDENNVKDAELYEIYQIQDVTTKVSELLGIKESDDMVNYIDILKKIKNDGTDICDYCNKNSFACRYCNFQED